ncbi:flagellar hook-associated protein 3 FlgL [Idiomarina fontislapidosi]|uniref:Flagellar hook-associated protein 3 n=1 Tax=Idiomarina fontislapidosi TaxID=263723 RepID=A0A432XYJ9_9GAMM|nr:flagellar hook-associated protein FlgL [Idiomarina fontislapidosi]PYE32769.1 flagellar hook-associated protein 3 FlgL [Idiomarina fontislapidosi]RUO53790.1 flagellar hook-associated protein 3 [Idiomarina fontislapidosi]
MRLSTNLYFKNNLDNLLRTQERVNTVQEKLTKQTNILTPADDPIGNTQVLALNEKISQNEQFARNSNFLENSLKREESVLGNINLSLNRARQLAVQAGNGVNSEQDYKAIGQELAAIEQEVFDLMNTRDEAGNFIFGGYQNRQQPFEYDPTSQSYKYQNDDGQRTIQISPTLKLAAGDPGSEVFGLVSKRTNVTLQNDTIGVENVTVPDRKQFTDISEQLYDNATPVNNFVELSFTGPNTFDVLDAAGNTIAGGQTFVPGAPIEAIGLEIDYTGTPAAGDTVQVGFDEPVERNVASVIGDLARTLQDSASLSEVEIQNQIGFALDDLAAGNDQILSARSGVGARINVMENANNSNADFQVVNKETRASIEDIDWATAITDLTKSETILEASRQIFSRVSGLSLFDYLR